MTSQAQQVFGLTQVPEKMKILLAEYELAVRKSEAANRAAVDAVAGSNLAAVELTKCEEKLQGYFEELKEIARMSAKAKDEL